VNLIDFLDRLGLNEHLKVSGGTNQIEEYVGKFVGIRFMSLQCSNLAL
jgi:hypothetical protein